ncbi:MAG TPA: lysophospholipid acyltransferase family protein [Bacteroidales bacterium]|nr:lysophospholipid acyltransferase family protein [Bacteroidales bacterium]HPS61731.1 lysophospholipid acyltransferase family protein [Bacteroidales bacterium]
MRVEITANNEYHTPGDAPEFWLNKALFHSRFVFTGLFLKTVFTSRSRALKGLYDNRAWIDSSHDIFTSVERCGGRIHLEELDQVRNSPSPVLFLSNHMSTLETMILPGILQPIKDITFVVKRELVEHWAFRDVMRSRNPIVLSRSNPREDLKIIMEEGPKILEKGISIVIFPEGTRRKEFHPEDFNSLGTKLAARTGVPVIPIALKTDFWGFGRFSSYLGPINRERPVRMAFGAPIRVSGSGKEEHQQITGFIRETLDRWKKMD